MGRLRLGKVSKPLQVTPLVKSRVWIQTQVGLPTPLLPAPVTMPSCLDNFKGMGTSFLSGTSLEILAMLIHLTLPLASEVSVSLAIRTLQKIKLHREVRESKGDAEPGPEADASLFLHL